MHRYLEGDESAGEKLQATALVHGYCVGSGVIAAKGVSEIFAQTHVYEKIGRFCGKILSDSTGSSVKSLEIIERIRPKHAKMLKSLIDKSGFNAAELIIEDYENKGVEKVKETLDVYEGGVQTTPTDPSLPKGSKPRGEYALEINDGIKGQNRAAKILANEGYDIEMLPEIEGGNGYGIKSTKNPDFLIEDNVFDCYTPDKNTNVDSTLCKEIYTKTKEQADRIILNLGLRTKSWT